MLTSSLNLQVRVAADLVADHTGQSASNRGATSCDKNSPAVDVASVEANHSVGRLKEKSLRRRLRPSEPSIAEKVSGTTPPGVNRSRANKAASGGSWDDSFMSERRRTLINSEIQKNLVARYQSDTMLPLDLADLKVFPETTLKIRAKSMKKHDSPHVALVDQVNFNKNLAMYKEIIRGVPGFIDAFFRGEEGGRSEGFALHPEEFVATSFDPAYGGFLLSPNPSNVPVKGKTYIDNPRGVVELTKTTGGFGLVAFWIPPNVYEGCENFQKLFPSTPVPANYPGTLAKTGELNRIEQAPDQELINDYEKRTGNTFLATPMDLGAEHIAQIKECGALAAAHLQDVYNVDLHKEKLEIYTHGPVYALDTAGFHLHVRVNEGRHPAEQDVRVTYLADIIKQLENTGKLDKLETKSGKAIMMAPALKPKDYEANGIAFELVPNAWQIPKRVAGAPQLQKYIEQVLAMRIPQRYEVTPKASGKYDNHKIALIDRPNLMARLEKYDVTNAVPDFVHSLLIGTANDKTAAFRQHPAQFAATPFRDDIGGMFIMPNTSYVPGKKDAFDHPQTIRTDSGNQGFGLVAYWVPPQKYEGHAIFEQLFRRPQVNPATSVASSEPAPTFNGADGTARESIAGYRQRTGNHFIATSSDMKKEHLPLLDDFLKLADQHLREVYKVEDDDKVDLYVHNPVYGNKTAGLHFHIRVNQGIHPGEGTQKLDLQRLRDILADETMTNDDVKNAIIDAAPQTKSGKLLIKSPTWDPNQFEGTDYTVHVDPYSRPYLQPKSKK